MPFIAFNVPKGMYLIARHDVTYANPNIKQPS